MLCKLQAVGFLLAGCLFIGAGCSNQPADKPSDDKAAKADKPDAKGGGDTSSKPGTKPTASGNSSSTPAPGDLVKVNPSTFKTEVDDDIDAAEKKYQGKTLEIRGRAKYVMYLEEKDSVVVFQDANGDDDSPTMECRFSDKRLWEKAVPGQVLVIRGKIPRFLSGAGIVECEVVKAETAATEITATELTAEFLADPAATREKYKQQWLICSGVVHTPLADTAISSFKKIVVETNADTKLSFVSSNKAFLEEFADLKAGDAIKVAGEYNTSVSPVDVEKGKNLELTNCLPLSPVSPDR